MIAIIDYGMGNVRSVLNAITYIGQDAVVTSEHAKIKDSSHIILPGVGAFGKAISNLKNTGLVDILNKEVMEKKKPFLGICLGLQLLAKSSNEHGFHAGLGWIDAEVRQFTSTSNSFKLPHMGWNDITVERKHHFFSGLKEDQLTFYFVHSYYIDCKNQEDIAATCVYATQFPAAIIKGNIIATQFHPEKSQDNGIQLLRNFVNWWC